MVTLDQAGLARGWTHIIPAPPRLASFVEFFWVQSAAPVAARKRGWRIVPDASPHLIVKRLHGIAGDTTAPAIATRATFVGARSRYVESDMPRREWTAGVRFRPGTIPLLTRLRAADFTDRGVSLEDTLGAAGRHIETHLSEAGDAEEAIRVLQDALVARLGSAPGPDRRIRGLIRIAADGTRAARLDRPAVAALVDEMGVRARTLRQRCADDIGLPPVLVLRVARLHNALRQALPGSAPGGWAGIAARTGYFDQSHLIRDFRLLLGESPGEFVRRSAG